MHVGVVEARHHKMSLEIDDGGCRTFLLKNLFIAPHCDDSLSANGQCLRSFDFLGRGHAYNPGVDFRVNVDSISRSCFCWAMLLRACKYGEKKKNRQGKVSDHLLAPVRAPARARTRRSMRCNPRSLPSVSNHS